MFVDSQKKTVVKLILPKISEWEWALGSINFSYSQARSSYQPKSGASLSSNEAKGIFSQLSLSLFLCYPTMSSVILSVEKDWVGNSIWGPLTLSDSQAPIEIAPSAMRPASHPDSRDILIILGSNFHPDVNNNSFFIHSWPFGGISNVRGTLKVNEVSEACFLLTEVLFW